MRKFSPQFSLFGLKTVVKMPMHMRTHSNLGRNWVSATASNIAADFVQLLAKDLNSNDLELPAFPDAVVRIQQAFQAQDARASEIVRIISSDPALAASMLKIANSAAVRASADEIVDVRKAVVQMGFKLVQSSAVSYALRQMQRNEGLSEEARTALKEIWTQSVDLAALSYVIAKNFTKLNADEAMLAGLLSVLGKLYIFMKSLDFPDMSYAEMDSVFQDWHPAIAKAIAETWGMSDSLTAALESQLETDIAATTTTTLTEVLVAARLFAQHDDAGEPVDGSLYPVLQRMGISQPNNHDVTLHKFQEQIDNIRNALLK